MPFKGLVGVRITYTVLDKHCNRWKTDRHINAEVNDRSRKNKQSIGYVFPMMMDCVSDPDAPYTRFQNFLKRTNLQNFVRRE
jgi:hypothetical protein